VVLNNSLMVFLMVLAGAWEGSTSGTSCDPLLRASAYAPLGS
jgi:hypothetical protein